MLPATATPLDTKFVPCLPIILYTSWSRESCTEWSFAAQADCRHGHRRRRGGNAEMSYEAPRDSEGREDLPLRIPRKGRVSVDTDRGCPATILTLGQSF